jgi:3-oxoacyl-[acyl-carrier-protein] synthase III (EC 2.3.1.41)
MIYSKLLGTGSYLPEQIVTNDDLAKRMETSDEWIRSRTGIRQRHVRRQDKPPVIWPWKLRVAHSKQLG